MSPSLRLLVGAGVGVAAIVYLLHRSRTKQAPKKQLKEIRRLDYRPSAFSITEVDLVVRLDDPELSQALGQGTVTAIETVLEMTAPSSGSEDLVLNAEELHVVEVAVSASPKLSGWTLLEADKDFVYDAEAETLTVARKRLGSGSFALRTVVTVKPETNLELQGLYKSSGIFCTQMEAEGYRRMAPHLDRPDVLCTYRVRIEADKAACPVLLSNGNRVGEGPLPGGRHYATYFDPFPKPSYLVALVAGNLGCLKGGFQTMSGKTVEICIYTEPEFVDQLGFAMQSIQKAMEWDEVQFGREYDLDVFNIVAVADFNMGAMENKSLNVFNSKCVLALPTSATDATMRRVEGIIAHEYFHNWTGNRVTCRDWFQLTLKEGLTVYRDTRFTSDTSDPTVKRIGDVKTMRQMQFPEDAGPMAHPIRPEAYVKMDNFYTRTVYRKGAEVIRLYETLVGREGFRKGCDLYFERHDGQAVTCDEFRAAIADANGSDAIRSEAFGRWYTQAGTPTLRITRAELAEDSAGAQRYVLELAQSTPPTPGQRDKAPLLLPTFEVELQGAVAKDAPLTLSILRGWSAPVILDYPAQTASDLATLMAHDSDGFNRYESAARFASRCVLDMATKLAAGPAADDVYPAFDAAFLDAWGSLFDSADAFLESGTCHLLAMMLRLPADVEVLNMMSVYDAEAVKKAKRALMRALASQRASALLPLYRRVRVNPKASYELTAAHEGRRALAAVLLGYAAALGTEETSQAVAAHYNEASNMTDASAALEIIASTDCKQRQGILDDFEAQWRSHREVIDTWFTVQATSSLPNAEARLRELMRHETFSLSNPNKVRAVVGVLATMAPHVLFQSGVLKLLGEVICTVDATNGNLAASLCKLLQVWRKLPEPLRSEAKAVLEKVSSRGGCSKNAGEVCVTALRD